MTRNFTEEAERLADGVLNQVFVHTFQSDKDFRDILIDRNIKALASAYAAGIEDCVKHLEKRMQWDEEGAPEMLRELLPHEEEK